MIQVTFRNNTDKKIGIVDENTTLHDAMEQNGMSFMTGTIHLNGTPLKPDDMDKTFSDFGITESCYLINVIKTCNA